MMMMMRRRRMMMMRMRMGMRMRKMMMKKLVRQTLNDGVQDTRGMRRGACRCLPPYFP